ncbi:uncharacterized protein LOC113572533 [Electrophorus electricus]|uniref:Uncharacterized protein n=1 Tax=Electrophorus electricus TaxID=8005 RepID=A0A4W4GHC6_ELEEL|nr:uncharacterized protein LOC113572533 [Electrophorus electricus]
MTSADIIKATKNITKASSCRDDTKMIMQPYANWEEYLTPGPISIAILGELVFISSKVDFSINKNPPKDGFKFIKYPESFRACLMQICNSGWRAFNEAHKNMDQIRLHTGNIPEYIKMCVKILLQDKDELVQSFLPSQLQNIDSIATDCLELAASTERKFMEVIELIQEVLEACLNAKQSYTQELKEVKQKLEAAKLKKEILKEINEQAEKSVNQFSSQLKEAQTMFKQSMDSLPNGWEMIGMDFVEGMTGSVNSLLSGITSICTGAFITDFLKTESNTSVSGEGMNQKQSAKSDPVALNDIFSSSSHILMLSQAFNQVIANDKISLTEIRDESSGTIKSDFQKHNFEAIKEYISKRAECEPKQEVLSICENGILICNDLAKYAEKGEFDQEKNNKLVSDMRSLIKLAQIFDSKSKAVTRTPAFAAKPPQLLQIQSSSSKKTASQTATENARFKIEQSRAQLEHVRATYDKYVDEMKKKKEELNKVLQDMRKCEVQKIDFDTTIMFLVKGLDAMGRVKEQWEKLVRFFQMVSNIIKTCLSTSLNDFTKTVNAASKLKYSPIMFIKDMIYTQAFYCSNISSLVNMIAGTYTEVSKNILWIE